MNEWINWTWAIFLKKLVIWFHTAESKPFLSDPEDKLTALSQLGCIPLYSLFISVLLSITSFLSFFKRKGPGKEGWVLGLFKERGEWELGGRDGGRMLVLVTWKHFRNMLGNVPDSLLVYIYIYVCIYICISIYLSIYIYIPESLYNFSNWRLRNIEHLRKTALRKSPLPANRGCPCSHWKGHCYITLKNVPSKQLPSFKHKIYFILFLSFWFQGYAYSVGESITKS